MAQQISQAALLFDINSLNESILRMATVSAMSLVAVNTSEFCKK